MDNKNSTSPQSPIFQKETPFIRTVIKISFGIFAGLLIVWAFFRNENKNNLTQPIADSVTTDSPRFEMTISDTSKSGTVQPELLSDNNNEDKIILQLEDPNQPPYRAFISASQNGKQLFAFDYPEGKSMTVSDSLVEVELPDKPGTNLISETFRVLVSRGDCALSEEMADWTKIKIGDKDFNKGNGGGASAGTSYSMSYYSFSLENYCVTFSLRVHTGNARAYSEPVTEINAAKEEEAIETILKNIKFK